MILEKNILKNKPDYENYTENEVKLTIEEMRELGLLTCGGCCGNKDKSKKNCEGCGKNGKCCNRK